MPRLTQRDWDPYKNDIEILYVRDRKELMELMEIMKDRHGFVAKKRQYVYILEQWGFRKNKTEKAALSQAALPGAMTAQMAAQEAAQKVPIQIDSPVSVSSLGREMPCPTAEDTDHDSESWNGKQSQQCDLMLAFPHDKTTMEYMERRCRMSKASRDTSLGQTILFGCIRLNDGCLTDALLQALGESQPPPDDFVNCLTYNLMYHALGYAKAANGKMLEDISRYLEQAKSPGLDLFPLLSRFAFIQDAQQQASIYDLAMPPMAMTFIKESYVSRLSQNEEVTSLLREGFQWCRNFLLRAHPMHGNLPVGDGSIEHARQQAVADACCAIARHLLCESRESLPRWAQESKHHLGVSRITCAILIIRTASDFYLAESSNQLAMLEFHQQITEGASALLLSTDEFLWRNILDKIVEIDNRSLLFTPHTFLNATPSTHDQYSSPQVVADDSVFLDNLGHYVQQFVLEHLAPEMYETDSDQLSACSELDVFTTSGSHRGSHSPMTPFQNPQNSQFSAQDFGTDDLSDPPLFPQAYPAVPGVGDSTPNFHNMSLDFGSDGYPFSPSSFPS